jgi:hypothetical protein
MGVFLKIRALFSSYCQMIYMSSIIGKQCKKSFSPMLVVDVWTLGRTISHQVLNLFTCSYLVSFWFAWQSGYNINWSFSPSNSFWEIGRGYSLFPIGSGWFLWLSIRVYNTIVHIMYIKNKGRTWNRDNVLTFNYYFCKTRWPSSLGTTCETIGRSSIFTSKTNGKLTWLGIASKIKGWWFSLKDSISFLMEVGHDLHHQNVVHHDVR